MHPGSGSRSTVTRTPVRSSTRARCRTVCSSSALATPMLAPQPSRLNRARQPSGTVDIDAVAVPGGSRLGSMSANSAVYSARRVSAQCGS